MPTTAKVICDSISESGVRLTTLVLEYPRIIHAEFMTHRMFSRNASSSRAIPVEKQIERVENDPFVPTYWGANQKGMQASEELAPFTQERARGNWIDSMFDTVKYVKNLVDLKVHKQLANRLLEPFSHIQVVVTATEWEGFFAQRLHPAAQPEIQELAKVMKKAFDSSKPKILKVSQWHLPFVDKVSDDEVADAVYNINDSSKASFDDKYDTLRKVSVARCARVSYGLNERGWGDIEKDLALYDMLATSGHWSPFEHQATPIEKPFAIDNVDLWPGGWQDGVTHMDKNFNIWSGNFRSWIQNRQLIQTSA